MSAKTALKCIGAAAAFLSIIISVSTAVWIDNRLTAEATDSLRRVTVVLAGQTLFAFESLDLMLRHAVSEIELAYPSWIPLDEKRIHALLAEDSIGLTHSQALILFAKDGSMIAHSRLFPRPALSVQDRDYFIAHAATGQKTDAGLFIGAPTANRVNGNLMVPISRRFDIDGRFSGVLMAALDLNYFNELYARMYVPANGYVYARRSDGTLLASWPVGASIPTGADYLSFTAPVPEYGLSVGMSVSRDSLRAPWRPVLFALMAGLALSLSCVLAMALVATVKPEETKRTRWTPSVIKGGIDNE